MRTNLQVRSGPRLWLSGAVGVCVCLLCTWFPGITPPQNAVSTKHFPLASRSFWWKLVRVVVGGMLFLLQPQKNPKIIQRLKIIIIDDDFKS